MIDYLPSSFWSKFKNFQLYPNDYVMALTRPILNHQLKIAQLTTTKALLNQRVARVVFTENDNFLYQVLSKRSTVDYIGNVIAGTDPPDLSAQALSLIKVKIPSKNEQKIIGETLRNLDNLIASNQLQQKNHESNTIRGP